MQICISGIPRSHALYEENDKDWKKCQSQMILVDRVKLIAYKPQERVLR